MQRTHKLRELSVRDQDVVVLGVLAVQHEWAQAAALRIRPCYVRDVAKPDCQRRTAGRGGRQGWRQQRRTRRGEGQAQAQEKEGWAQYAPTR